MPETLDPAARAHRSLEAAERLAAVQGGVVSRRQVYAAGLTRGFVRSQIRARRWQKLGDQSVVLHNSEVSDVGHRWAAVFQGGPRAQLDGASSLIAGGLARFELDRVRVSVPRGARVRRNARYDIRQTRRWAVEDAAPGSGVRRTRNDVAAVRAGLWAVSDKQAALVVTMAIQQGLTTAEDVGQQMLRVRKHRRRIFLQALVLDLLDGARSLGELDVVTELRRRGLPSPSRQVLRRDRQNRYYLDLYWPEWKLVVEIDGIHHAWAENVVSDALRQNALSLSGDTVLRLPLLGMRLQADDFFGQIEQALVNAGYSPAA